MTCDEIKNCILLMEAGELEPSHRAVITSHVENCADCKTFYDEQQLITRLADKALPTAEPSQDVINAILNQARTEHSIPEKKVIAFPSFATQLMAYAACFAVVLLGWFIMTQVQPGEPEGVMTADKDTVTPLCSSCIFGDIQMKLVVPVVKEFSLINKSLAY